MNFFAGARATSVISILKIETYGEMYERLLAFSLRKRRRWRDDEIERWGDREHVRDKEIGSYRESG
jgi:hypothetical protein